MGKRYKKYVDLTHRIDNSMSSLRRRCKCGHSMIVYILKERDYLICTWCGSRVYADENKQQEYDEKCKVNEFKFNLNKVMNNKKTRKTKK